MACGVGRSADGGYGAVQQDLKFRGRQVVLEYKGGSPCPGKTDYRKSMIMSFLCDQDISSEAAISFTGQLNECSYFFQVRTLWACPTIQETDVSPLAIFGIMYSFRFILHHLQTNLFPTEAESLS